MIKYLEYVTNELSKVDADNQNGFLSELQLYKDMYCKYEKMTMRSPIYKGNATLFNTHNFYLPTNETFSISWDIDLIYKKYESYPTTQYLSLADFNTLFNNDLQESCAEFNRVYGEVKTIHSHTYDDILTIFFKPLHCNLILDGRHRYTEFKKFKSDQLINVSYFNSNDIIDSIILSFDLVKYIILNNIDELNNFVLGKGNLEQIINFEKCGLLL